MELWDFLKNLVDPASIIQYGGIGLLLFVIFAETGLMIGFFLPGDSLVFVSGMFCSTKPELLGVNITCLILLMIFSAVVGNITGYWFGKKVGPALFKKDNTLIFKQRYLKITKAFYDRHRRKALILGRFLPITRTFAPILAGAVLIDFKKFMLYNIIGAFLWICSLGICGFFLGRIKWVEQNVGWIVIFLIVITLIPVVRAWKKERVILSK